MATKKTGSAAKGSKGKGLGSKLTPAQQKTVIKGLNNLSSNERKQEKLNKKKSSRISSRPNVNVTVRGKDGTGATIQKGGKREGGGGTGGG